MKKFIFILAMMLISINLYSSPPDSCLWSSKNPIGPVFSDESGMNSTPTIKLDTCGLYSINPGFYWKYPDGADTSGSYYLGFPSIMYYNSYLALKRIYSKSIFGIKMNWSVFDTTVKDLNTLHYFTVDDIDKKNQVIYDAFQLVKQTYGNIKFWFHFDKNISIYDAWMLYSNENDSHFERGVSVYIESENFVNTVEFVEFVNTHLHNIQCDYLTELYLPVSVNDNEIQNQYFIFPNPVSDFLMIRGLDESQIKLFSIYNTLGQKLFESELTEQIDVSYLKSGVYFLRIGNMNYKFVKL